MTSVRLLAPLVLALVTASCASQAPSNACPGACEFSTCKPGYHEDGDAQHSCHTEDFVCCVANGSAMAADEGVAPTTSTP